MVGGENMEKAILMVDDLNVSQNAGGDFSH